MKQGLKGQITTAGWSAISNFSRSWPISIMWRESRTRGGCAMRPGGLKMTPESLRPLRPISIFSWNVDCASRSSLVVKQVCRISLAKPFATVARILITGSHRECAKGQEDQLRGWRENGRDERFYWRESAECGSLEVLVIIAPIKERALGETS